MLDNIKKIRIILIIILVVLILLAVAVELMRRSAFAEPRATQTGLDNIAYDGTSTPIIAKSNSLITLPDGSRILLQPDAKIEIREQPGIPAQSDEIKIILYEGEIMVVPFLPEGKWLTVQSSTGYIARIQGCAMVVNFDGLLTFQVQCIAGYCEIGPNRNELIPAESNYISQYQVGKLIDPIAIDMEKLQEDYKDNFPACALSGETQFVPSAPSETPASTSTLTATATKTPTPTYTRMPTDDIDATATEACRLFKEEFPATPCP